LDRLENQRPETAVREELHAEGRLYVWTGSNHQPSSAGRVTVHARKIACRGADKGMPAGIIFREKLRQYQLRQHASREETRET
jgi:hypothetical protein